MNVQRSIAFVVCLSFSVAAHAQCAARAGLLNWWRSKPQLPWSGNSVIGDPWNVFTRDHAGSRNDGALHGSPVGATFGSGGGTFPYGYYCFPTANDYMSVTNHAEVDITDNDFTFRGVFSLDKSAKPERVATILDKRAVVDGKWFGYAIFLFDGRFGVQMADGTGPQSGATTFVEPSAGTYRDGGTHIFIVSVTRAPNGGRVWVDGNLVLTFTPPKGSLSNPADLLFARHAQGGAPLLGCLIEVQMYRHRAYTWSDFEVEPTCRCDAGPVTAWWRFDEEPGTIAFDSAGAPNDATRATPQPKPTPGKIRGAAQFTSNLTMRVRPSPELDLGRGPFTIAAWIKVPPDADGKRTILRKASPASRGYALYLVDGRLSFEMNRTVATMASTTPSLADDRWHLAGVWVNGTKGRLIVFRNGTEPLTQDFAPDAESTDTAEELTLAGPVVVAGTLVSSPFRGSIDELQIVKNDTFGTGLFDWLAKQASGSDSTRAYYGCR